MFGLVGAQLHLGFFRLGGKIGLQLLHFQIMLLALEAHFLLTGFRLERCFLLAALCFRLRLLLFGVWRRRLPGLFLGIADHLVQSVLDALAEIEHARVGGEDFNRGVHRQSALLHQRTDRREVCGSALQELRAFRLLPRQVGLDRGVALDIDPVEHAQRFGQQPLDRLHLGDLRLPRLLGFLGRLHGLRQFRRRFLSFHHRR